MKNQNYRAFETGNLADWTNYSVELPGLGNIPGKLFLKEHLGLTGCEISINALRPGEVWPANHTHQENEEIYFFIHGSGQMQVDGETLDVREGTVVRIDPSAARVWRNNSRQTLVYLVIQMRAGSLRQYGLGDGVLVPGTVTWPDSK